MDLSKNTLFASFGHKMKWLNERQKVLAQNIANANTPGYSPTDLKKISFSAHLDKNIAAGGQNTAVAKTSAAPKMLVTQAGHFSSAGATNSGPEIKAIDADRRETTPDGNSVNLEDELIKMADTQMEYTMALNLYKKHASMMKTALGKRN